MIFILNKELSQVSFTWLIILKETWLIYYSFIEAKFGQSMALSYI